MEYNQVLEIEKKVKTQLAPYCDRIVITQGISRREQEINKIEMAVILKPYVLIPEPYNIGLFVSGIETVVNQRTWRKVKGELPCDYMQRILPGNIMLDLYFTDADNWDFIMAKRTSAANYSYQRRAARRKCASINMKTATSLKIEEK